MAKWQEAPVVAGSAKATWKDAPPVQVDATPEDSMSDQQLLKMMAGRLPKKPEPMVDPLTGMTGPPDELAQKLYEMRQRAYDALTKRGYEAQQIATGLDVFHRIDQPMTVGRIAGAGLLGFGVPAALAAGQIPPFTALPEEAFTVGLLTRAGLGAARTGIAAAAAGTGDVLGQVAQSGVEGSPQPTAPEMLRGFLEGAGYEAGGRTAASGLGAAMGWAIKKPVRKAVEAAKEFYDTVGGYLTPAQQDKRIAIGVSEALQRSSLGGEQQFAKFGQWQKQKTAEWSAQIADRLAQDLPKMSDEELGRAVLGMADPVKGSKWQAIDAVVGPIYEDIDRLANTRVQPVIQMQSQPIVVNGKLLLDASGQPLMRQVPVQTGTQITGGRVSTARIKHWAKEKLAEDARMVTEGKGPLLTDAGRKELDTVMRLQAYVGYKDMRKWRSSLLAQERQLAFERNADTAMVRQLAGLADDAVYDPAAAKDLPAQARVLLNRVNSFYKSNKELWSNLYDDAVLKRLQDDPERVAKVLLHPENSQKMSQLKFTMTHKAGTVNGRPGWVVDRRGEETWNQFRRTLFTGVAQDATDAATGELRPELLARRLRSFSPEVRNLLLSPVEQKSWENLATVAQQMGASRTHSGGLFIKAIQFGQLAQVGAGVGLTAWGAAGEERDPVKILAGGSILFAPVVLAYLATDKQGQKLLLAGLRLPRGSNAAGPTAARMVRRYMQLRDEEKKTRQSRAVEEQVRTAQSDLMAAKARQGAKPSEMPIFIGPKF